MKRQRRGAKSRAPRAVRGVTFDTGMLIALEKRQAGALALLRACRETRARITIPATVVAEWWRGSHRTLLEIGDLEDTTPQLAQRAGELLASMGRDRRRNAIDATVVASAAQRGDLVITSDPADLRELAAQAAGVDVEPV